MVRNNLERVNVKGYLNAKATVNLMVRNNLERVNVKARADRNSHSLNAKVKATSSCSWN
jgi:hypothetical protein